MPLPSQDPPAESDDFGPQASHTLYVSATTRIVRPGGAAAAGQVVCKEYLGEEAAKRRRNEQDMLGRLAGIEGVAHLAGRRCPRNGLALADGGDVSLAQVLRGGKCETARVLSLAVQLARTLADVHRAGVIHRDIHPANILVSPAGQAVLIDFDHAVLAEASRDAAPDGPIVGTLGYLAPEQTGRTGRAVDERADLYALGATLYEMVTGRLPFDARDPLQLVHDHLVREPLAPGQIDAGVPAGLSAIVLRLLAKAPEQRYQSAAGLLHDLERLRAAIEQGSGGVFELGARDFPARLAAPPGLVGRDAELSVLRRGLADAIASASRTVLVEGVAGVGKSALIQQLRPAVAAAGGRFVQGKFDQYQKDGATVGGLTQALRALGRLLLAEAGDDGEAQRRRLLDGLGRGAGLVTRLLPEFELLLGLQGEMQDVDPRQAELQLLQAMVDLIGAVASPERPLVVVLDDLQWAGMSSLRAFQRLMGEPQLRGLLLIGAYRSEEMDALLPMLTQWREAAFAPLQITLANLDTEGMGMLLGRMLRLAPEPARDLAAAMAPLTGGNPFDTVEMTNALRRDGVLVLGEAGWQWDESRVRRFVGRGNVVDLLAARISRLAPASRELLECISCLGSTVECRLLAAAHGVDGAGLEERLREPLADGLLVAERVAGQDVVYFRHDRVQQAVLGTMDEARRAERQLGMARRLAARPTFEAEAAQQYLACVGRLAEPAEQRLAARLFHGLAQSLAEGAGYPLAERYLAAAGQLLDAANDPDDARLRASVDAARHAALYSLGRLDESDPLFDAMQRHAADPLDMVEPTCLQMRSLSMRGRMGDAMKLGLALLAQLGVKAPPDFAAADTGQRLDGLAEWVRRDSQVHHATRPQIHDRRLLAIAKLLGRTLRSAVVFLDTRAMVWLLLESQRVWAEHGPCAELVASLGRLSGMLIALRQDYRGAFDVARHVLAVGEALGYEPQTSEARFIFVSYACHWFEPLERAVDHCTRAYEAVRSRGDPAYACYVHVILTTPLVDTAPTIGDCEAEVQTGIELCQRTGNLHAAVQHACVQQLLRALRREDGPADGGADGGVDEQAFLARVGRSPYLEATYTEYRALHALLMGDVDALGRHAGALMPLLGLLPGYYVALRAHLSVALARAWQVQRDPSIDAAPLLAELEACRAWLAARAADQPYNFMHLLHLVEAEQAWAQGDRHKAARAFDAALGEAQSRPRPWQRALIGERAGLFQLHEGFGHAGRTLLAQALAEYEAWGATAKVQRMTREHGFLRSRPMGGRGPGAAVSVWDGNGVSSAALDLMGVLRASQALSSETSLERLNARVTEVLAALSGATKVLVLSRGDDRWSLLAPAPGEPPLGVVEAAERRLLPFSAFAYAERTGEALLVDDAVHDDRFSRDPYFAGMSLCSLLVTPISIQGTRRAMLLLENRQGRAAFNAQRLDAVMLIAGQLAVSLANAQLYESLEQRVHARTRELEQAQAELVASARNAGKAEIANNVLHNVGNVLNSINVSAGIVRRRIGNSRLGGLARALALLEEHRHDLGDFTANDPRGKALVPYLQDVVRALETERQEALDDLDRLTSSVDHITYVVATQQSLAGPSSVLETARPEALLEEALRLCADRIVRHNVAVLRRYEEVPATALDKQRLLQIMVNLIGNAAQAMEAVPEPARQLTLKTTVVQGEGGQLLRISVQDRGEGIASENLPRIFAHGFTTRKHGHGFGLHSSALAAMEMGGKLTVRSDGPGQGAVFDLELPLKPQAPAAGK